MTTITEIKNAVKASNGTFAKCSFKLNTYDAYEVNGVTYTKPQLIEAYKMGAL